MGLKLALLYVCILEMQNVLDIQTAFQISYDGSYDGSLINNKNYYNELIRCNYNPLQHFVYRI